MERVEAPFTKEQLENIKNFQNGGGFHPFTCCSPKNISECQRVSGENEGILIPTEQGFVCPCGKYKQNWCHKFMTEPQEFNF